MDLIAQPASPIARPASRALMARPTLRVTRSAGDSSFLWLRNGKPGSLQTASEMARLVREDATKDVGLERFAAQILINSGIDSHSTPDDILDAIFQYTQKLSYVYDSTGAGSFDAIQSARVTIELGYGDCDDLSTLLATLLAMVGFRPSFVLVKIKETSAGYDHVYVEVQLPSGRVALDPSSRAHGMGWESPKIIERLTFPIFGRNDGTIGRNFTGFAGAESVALTGAAVGLNFVPVVGPLLSMLVGPIASLFTPKYTPAQKQQGLSWDEQDKQIAAQLVALEQLPSITPDQFAQAQDAVNQLAQMSAQEAGSNPYVASQWKMEQVNYQKALALLATRVSSSAGSGPSSGAALAATAGSGSAPTTLSSVTSSLPELLLLAGGGFLLAKLLSR